MADLQSKIANREYYSKLKIYRSRLVGFLVMCSFVMAVVAVIVFTNITLELSWWSISLPVTGLGLIVAIYPPTEEWEYQPWQSSSEKREQTFYN